MAQDFDPAKDKENLRKHGLLLTFGQEIFNDPAYLVLPSIREIDGEERFKAIGSVNHKVYTAVYTIRDDRLRFISVRRSNKREERTYRP